MNYSWSPQSVAGKPDPLHDYKIVEKPININTRFWIADIEESDASVVVSMAGWFGVVDDEAHGIVAYARTLGHAEMIRAALVSDTKG
jgi:hypothetical protein